MEKEECTSDEYVRQLADGWFHRMRIQGGAELAKRYPSHTQMDVAMVIAYAETGRIEMERLYRTKDYNSLFLLTAALEITYSLDEAPHPVLAKLLTEDLNVTGEEIDLGECPPDVARTANEKLMLPILFMGDIWNALQLLRAKQVTHAGAYLASRDYGSIYLLSAALGLEKLLTGQQIMIFPGMGGEQGVVDEQEVGDALSE